MNGRISNRATKAEMRKKGRRLFDIKTGWRNVLNNFARLFGESLGAGAAKVIFILE